MNYLAHLFLSKNTDYSRMGNFLGDFVKGTREKLSGLYPEEVVKGIETHRLIDAYTDSHEEVKNAISILKPVHGLFSGIIVDVLFDHFLSTNWQAFSPVNRQTFIEACHESLSVHIPNLPYRFTLFLPILIDYDILNSYMDLDGIDHALFRIDQRFKRKTTLCGAVSDIKAHYLDLEGCFQKFFPEICKYVDGINNNSVA